MTQPDNLDSAGDILDAASEIKAAGKILASYPADADAISDAERAARAVLDQCAALRIITTLKDISQ